MDSQLAALRATVEAGFRHSAEMQLERYEAMSQSLREIAMEVRKTNGRVTRAEEHIRTLFAQAKGFMRGRHMATDEEPGDRKVTAREVWIAGAAIGGTVAVLKFLEWFGQLRGMP